MGIIKEPKDIDFTVQSEPWTDEELKDFRKIMKELKEKNSTFKNKEESRSLNIEYSFLKDLIPLRLRFFRSLYLR